MLVRDVMTVDPITIAPTTPAREAAATMVARRISILPVCEGTLLLGVVTRDHLVDVREDPTALAMTIMRIDPPFVGEWMTVGQATRHMRREGCKAAPVLRDGKLVGVITETDLLRPYLRTDAEIRVDVEESFNAAGLPVRARDVPITISDGSVKVGPLPDAAPADLLRRLIEGIDGVTAVSMSDDVNSGRSSPG